MEQESRNQTPAIAEPGADDWKGTARYEILSRLGSGGMGIVYEAFDRERRQVVALKTLLHYDPAALYLFKQEFRTLADVHHVNLVHLYELVVPEAGHVFFTMELVRGVDFRHYVRSANTRQTSRPPATAATMKTTPSARETARPTAPTGAATDVTVSRPLVADVDRLRKALRQLVEGIQALHSAGKVHRDIKPSNVLVTAEGRVVLLDFGVATELSNPRGEIQGGSGEMVGTARYMAPEQADDEPPTPASDWYSVGVMLYETLVGRAPFVGSAVDVLTLKSVMDPLPPSSCVDGVPPDLDALCQDLLQRDPAMRPAGQVILRRLGATRSSNPPPAPIGAVDTETVFIGREAQLETLREAFEATRSGRSVTVRVGGAPGMGKSTVVHRVLDELAASGEALVLRGRAYERESVPYKAVDSVIDALSRHLMRLVERGEHLPLPKDVSALGLLFPVLQRVAGISPPGDEPGGDPQRLRRRAFRALRELFATIAERQPLVLFVDDAQWGDVDSAVLLLELLRPPAAPPVLLVMTYRDNEAQASPFLNELRDHWAEDAEMRDVTVGPLDFANAQRLALTLLDTSDETAQRTAKAVARESNGSPFLIEELVRGNRGAAMAANGPTLPVLMLDQMIGKRLERLPEPARRLIEIVAVGGRPLPVSVVASASGVRDSVNETIALVCARRLARVGLRDGSDVVEMTHDCIREAIVDQLTSTTLRDYHGRLARALEGAQGVDAEAIAMHWLGAGDKGRAVRFAEGAAEQAAAKLAFDQAAQLFRFTLENGAPPSTDTQRVRMRLAQVLELAGRATESARVYLDLVEGATATQQVEYQRAAAEQLLSAGRIDEGAEILHRVLAAVGMSAPRSPLAALFWLLVYRVWLAVLGLRFKERGPDDVRPEDRLRVDALWTVSTGFGIVNIILGACMQARHFIEAFRKGDRLQVLRAASSQAAHIAAMGKPESPRERALVEIGRSLARREGELARAHVEEVWGIGLFVRGLWRQANEVLESREAAMSNRTHSAQARLFLARTYYFMGDPKECAKREARLYTESEDRGDLYTTVNMRTSTHVWKWLAADKPERARREVREALAQWPHGGFLVQHWQAMVYSPTIDLYTGDAEGAYERFKLALPALRKSLLLHAGFIRAVTFYTQGRLAIASIDSNPKLRKARIAEARRMARRLRREYNPWTAMLAALVEAVAENAAGDRLATIAALRRAIESGDASGTGLYTPGARYRLGEMLGGDEGRELMRNALQTLTDWGVRNPARWLWLYMPGTWRAG
jgi:hypothetical protein